jgi:hypothetical protein
MILEDVLVSLAVVIVGSLIASIIFPIIFLKMLHKLIQSSATKFISHEMKKKASEWLQEVVKNGISEALKDEDVKKMVVGILELTRKIITDKFIKDDEEEKIGGGKEKK